MLVLHEYFGLTRIVHDIHLNWRRHNIAAGMAVLGLGFCSWLAAYATARAGGALDIEAQGAWIRWLPAGLPAAGYVTLTNRGTSDIELVAASSADYAEVGMHETRDDHGMSQMRPVASLALKPHATLRFAEGGYHLMLMQPQRAVRPGDRIDITFRSEDGRTITIPFEVRAASWSQSE